MKVTTWTSSVGRNWVPSRGAGFTLIELIVVLAIVGLSAALALPHIAGSVENARIRATLREASSLMRRARVYSVLYRKECRVVVDGEKGVLTLAPPQAQGEETPPWRSKEIHMPWGLNIDRLEGESWSGKVSGEHFKEQDIVFYPMGNSSGGRLYLKDHRGRTYLIKVNPLNGKVRVSYEPSGKG